VGGSSPRSWGTRAAQVRPRSLPRFIPTLVGNARRAIREGMPSSVHPHARGERIRRAAEYERDVGSSPRSWGTRPRMPARRTPSRFIPTLVGNASAVFRTAGNRPVHPHARGERVLRYFLTALRNGSSPRSWGTHLSDFDLRLVPRFIPTLVGNAVPIQPSHTCGTVHPHARGERQLANADRQGLIGSSPRSWGTHVHAAR